MYVCAFERPHWDGIVVRHLKGKQQQRCERRIAMPETWTHPSTSADRQAAMSSLMSLDQEQPLSQNHQYLALNYDFETALGWHRRAALERNPTAALRMPNRNARSLDTPLNIG